MSSPPTSPPKKLILQTNVTLNGYMSGPKGDLSWMTPWDSDLNAYIDTLMSRVDHMLLGRKLAEGFIPHWEAYPAHETKETCDKFNRMRKTVFSRNVSGVGDEAEGWGETTRMVGVDGQERLRGAVEQIKQGKEGGKDVIVYGGVDFVQSLVGEGLVDEFCLIVHPVTIEEGEGVFVGEGKFDLVEAKSFGCGIVVMKYTKGNG